MMACKSSAGTLEPEFILAVCIANFPESFSGASLLVTQGMPTSKAFGMWLVAFVLEATLAGVTRRVMSCGRAPAYSQKTPHPSKLTVDIRLAMSAPWPAGGRWVVWKTAFLCNTSSLQTCMLHGSIRIPERRLHKFSDCVSIFCNLAKFGRGRHNFGQFRPGLD